MNKKFFTFLLGLAAVFVLLLGCEKEENFTRSIDSNRRSELAALERGKALESDGDEGGLSGNGVLEEYISSLRAFAYYSGALTLKPRNEGDAMSAGINPITRNIQYDFAFDPSGERQYDFFELDIAERADFYEQILEDEKKFLSERLRLEPNAAVILEARSRAFQRVMREYVNVDVLNEFGKWAAEYQSNKKGILGGVTSELEAINIIPEQEMRERSNKMLSKLEEEMESAYEGIGFSSSSGDSNSSEADSIQFDEEFTKKMRLIYVAKGVRRGQILYRGLWENSSTGHAAIIINPNIPTGKGMEQHVLSVDAYKRDGVRARRVGTWNCKHYVLGVRRIWYTWEKSWWIFKKRVRHEKKLLDMSGAADVAWSKRDCPYGRIFRSKCHSESFICSSLVWYSVKHGCAIDGEAVDLAAWRPYTIWPTDLWLDSKTYVVAEVKR